MKWNLKVLSGNWWRPTIEYVDAPDYATALEVAGRVHRERFDGMGHIDVTEVAYVPATHNGVKTFTTFTQEACQL